MKRLKIFQKPTAIIVVFLFILSSHKGMARSLADLYQSLKPAVVVLRISREEKKLQLDENGKEQQISIEDAGEGSGFLVSKRLILTAAHVVHGADQVIACFADNTCIPAWVVSSDVQADLSLLKLQQPYLKAKPLLLADSNQMRIGDPVFVIGAPYSVSYTLTRGIISGRHQAGSEADYYKSEFFQTDAALNPGNSGGPLFNMQGKVIGVASFIKTRSGGNEGLGFAVTINTAKKLMLDRPPFYSGITVSVIRGALAKALNVPQSQALLVQRVARYGAGKKLGLKGGLLEATIAGKKLQLGGDIILAINGIKTDSEPRLQKIDQLLYHPPNTHPLTLTILRDGKVIQLKRH